MRAKANSNYGSDGEEGSANRTFSIQGHVLHAPKPVPGLYLVATPIGNLGDITLRALETLAGVDIIACEDTRITRRLTERYAISAELKPYHEHNATMARPKILEKLAQGASIALVSDAGTPLISDPGFKLVREVCAAGHVVIAVPGASSVLTALSKTSGGRARISVLSGMLRRSSRSSLPARKKTEARRRRLAMASIRRCSPSMAMWPFSVLDARANPARNSLTRAFCRLCTMRGKRVRVAVGMGAILTPARGAAPMADDSSTSGASTFPKWRYLCTQKFCASIRMNRNRIGCNMLCRACAPAKLSPCRPTHFMGWR